MVQRGEILEVNGEFAVAMVKKESSCADSCASCGMCDTSKIRKVKVLNEDELKVGEEVSLLIESHKTIFLALVTYILPLIIFFTSFAFLDNELFSALIFIFAFFVCSHFANFLAGKKKFMTRAKRIKKYDGN